MANGNERQRMEFLKNVHKHIPGFRQLSSQSMVIASTYYVVALAAMLRYWYWGLLLLALPFLIFNLLDLNAKKGGRLPLVLSAAAGMMVLAGFTGALLAGPSAGAAIDRYPRPSVSASAAAPTAMVTATDQAETTSPEPAAATTLAPAASSPAAPEPPGQTAAPTARPSAAKAAEPAEYAFVAAKGGEVFHRPDCASARRIKTENRIEFKTRDQAVAAGLRPCKRCKP